MIAPTRPTTPVSHVDCTCWLHLLGRGINAETAPTYTPSATPGMRSMTPINVEGALGCIYPVQCVQRSPKTCQGLQFVMRWQGLSGLCACDA